MDEESALYLALAFVAIVGSLIIAILVPPHRVITGRIETVEDDRLVISGVEENFVFEDVEYVDDLKFKLYQLEGEVVTVKIAEYRDLFTDKINKNRIFEVSIYLG